MAGIGRGGVIGGARAAAGLVVILALGGAVLAAGGAVTATSVGTWYQGLAKPAFNPPDAVFGPVWTALFVLMSFAAWRVWRRGSWAARRGELTLYLVQLALNLGWSCVFFGLQRIGWGLAEMVVLFAAIVATMVAFWRCDRIAGLLFVPYAAWVAFALVLNGAIWTMN